MSTICDFKWSSVGFVSQKECVCIGPEIQKKKVFFIPHILLLVKTSPLSFCLCAWIKVRILFLYISGDLMVMIKDWFAVEGVHVRKKKLENECYQ